MADLLVPVAFRTLGCKVNRAESESIAAELLRGDVRLVDESEAAVVVVNTCTVTGEADAKARKAVRHALLAGRDPVVVVTGCLAALDKAGLEALSPRVVVEADKSRVADRVRALAPGVRVDAVTPSSSRSSRAGRDFRTRAMLKIQDGCENFCSYCIVPYARGACRSVPLDSVREQARALANAGTREIVLTGINLGRYRDGLADLAELVETVVDTGIERVRLSSIEPPDLTERLLGVLSADRQVCEHLHVPLQSGSDAVLQAMGRAYDVAAYADRIAAAREALPGLAITTDVIAGFPGETDAQFAETLDLVESVGFAKLHVFRYSARSGTPAADMASQVPAEVRARRAAALREAGDAMRSRYVAGRLGQVADVLVERVEAGIAEGTTRDYLHVRFDAGSSAVGDIVRVPLEQGRIAR